MHTSWKPAGFIRYSLQVFWGTFLQKNAKTLSTVFNMWAETTKESAAAAVSTQQIAKQAPSANWFLLFFEVQSVVLGCHVLNCAIDRNSNCTSILQWSFENKIIPSLFICTWMCMVRLFVDTTPLGRRGLLLFFGCCRHMPCLFALSGLHQGVSAALLFDISHTCRVGWWAGGGGM